MYFVAADPGSDGGEAIFIYSRGTELALPMEALPFVRALAAHREFVAEDAVRWDSALTWADAQTLLAELVAAGILELAHDPPRGGHS